MWGYTSHGLNSVEGGYVGDYIEEYYRGSGAQVLRLEVQGLGLGLFDIGSGAQGLRLSVQDSGLGLKV